jgi:LysM repeat protein
VTRSLRLGGAALAVGLLLPAPSAMAAGEGTSGTANYSCNLTAGGNAPVTVTLALGNAPDSVKPGQTLQLSGSVTFGFTAQTSIQTQLLLASKIGVASADFGISAETAGHTDRISARSVEAPEVPAVKPLKPFSVTAKVVLPAYKVPASAKGDVVLSLPSAATQPNTVAKSPAKVAFTAVLSQTGLIHKRSMACVLSNTDTAPLITRIPVTADASSSLGGAGGSVPGGPALSAPSQDALPPADASPRASSTEAQTRPVFEAIPPSTRHSGVFLPAWSLVVVGLMLPIGAVLYTVSLRHRLRLMQLAAGGATLDPDTRRRS